MNLCPIISSLLVKYFGKFLSNQLVCPFSVLRACMCLCTYACRYVYIIMLFGGRESYWTTKQMTDEPNVNHKNKKLRIKRETKADMMRNDKKESRLRLIYKSVKEQSRHNLQILRNENKIKI